MVLLELMGTTTVAKQRTSSFHIDAMHDNPVGVVKPGFIDDEDDEGDEQRRAGR